MSNRSFHFANRFQTMISAIRAAPLRVLFLAVAVAVCGLMTVTDLPSAAPVHAQRQEVTPTKEATGDASPERPTDLEASASHDSVGLTWTASTDDTVTHYAVLRRDRNADASGVFHVIDSNAGPGLSYTDASVSAEGSYVYRVKAVSPTGVSQWSSYARANTPAAPTPTPTPEPTPESTPEPTPEPKPDPEDLAPTGLTAALADAGGVSLSWSAPAQDAGTVTGYEILRAQGDEELATLVADTGSIDTSHTDAAATTAGDTYAYVVAALRGEEKSRQSNQAQVQVPHDPADLAPSGLSARVVSGDDGVIEGVALSWSAPAEDAASVTGYEVLRAVGDGEMATLVADTGSAGATYTDATATEAGESYAYRVKALRDGEASQPSGRAVAIIPKVTSVEPEPRIAERQTTTEVWSATLTPADLTSAIGCANAASSFNQKCSNSGVLSEDQFQYGGVSYAVVSLLDYASGNSAGTFVFLPDPILPDWTHADLTLNIGNTSLSLSNATGTDFAGTSWPNSSVSLTAGTDVTVSLVDVDETPAVASVDVTSTPSATTNTYGLGETIEITVTFDQAVTVTGTPRIQLRIGGTAAANLKWADYSSGSGNEALVFAYTVQSGDMDDNGIYIEADELELNGGTIQSVDNDEAARLTYARQGTQSGHTVDASLDPVNTPTAPPQNVDDTLTINLYADVDKPVDQLGIINFQEGDGSVRIGLRAETNGPRPTEDFTATLNALDQTAFAGKDYEWPSQTFTFIAADFTLDEGRYVLTVSNYLRIINDEVVEKKQYFELSLDETTLPSYVTAVKPDPRLDILTVEIHDEDRAAVRFVDMLMIEGEESETRVVLDAQVKFPFDLVLSLLENENYGPKEAFEPYSLAIFFDSFETETTFRLKSIDNDQHEPNQVFEVDLIRIGLHNSISLIEDPVPTVTVINNDPELEITDITKDSATARMTVQNADGLLEKAYFQYGPLPFLNLRKGNWGDTMTVDIRGQDEVDLPLRDLEPATGYAVRVSLYPDFPKVNTRMREFTTRFGNLPEPPNSLSHTHKLTPYYQNGERKGFTLDWTAPILGGDDVVGYRIVRYYQNLEPGPLGIGPQPPVTLVENTRSQDTEYTDVGPLANGNYTYLVWVLDDVGPHPEFSRSTGTVTDAFDPPGKPVNVTAEAYPDRVELDWDEPEEGASPVAYVVERVVPGERGTGQVNHFETVRDDQPDNRTFYTDFIQRERGALVNYYVYSADIRGFRSAPVKLEVRLGPDGSAHTPRLVSVDRALITWLPPAEYHAGRDAAEKVKEKEGHTGEQVLAATVNTGLPDDPWVTRYRIEVNTWEWRKLRPHGPEGDLRIYDVDNDSWQEVAIVGEGGAEGYGPDSNEFRFRHFNIEDSDLLHHGDSILVRVSADNGFGWGPPSFLWELSGGTLQTREDAYLDRGSVELLPLRRPSLGFTTGIPGYYELEIARNMPPERYGLKTIRIENRSGGGGWELLTTLEGHDLESNLQDEQEVAEFLDIELEDAYQRFWRLEQYREDCAPVDYRARVSNTKGEVSVWSKTLTVSCPGQ